MTTERKVFINADARFITPLCVVIHSLLLHNDPAHPIVIYLAHDADFLRGDSAQRLQEIVARFSFARIEFLDFTPIYTRYQRELAVEGNPWPPLVWAFPLFTLLLPDITGNIVYLDADMLVRKDLGELFDLNLAQGGYLAAAVNECAHAKRVCLERLGWPADAGAYFNNGTMVVDADAYRREGIAERIPALFAAHARHFYCVDQDLQNVLLGTRTLRLPMRWNYHDTWLKAAARQNLAATEWDGHRPIDVLKAALDPCIVHYIGRYKPWNYTHRPERNIYRAEMRTLGLLKNGRLPGETPLKAFGGLFYDGLHALLKAYVRLRLRTLQKSA